MFVSEPDDDNFDFHDTIDHASRNHHRSSVNNRGGGGGGGGGDRSHGNYDSRHRHGRRRRDDDNEYYDVELNTAEYHHHNDNNNNTIGDTRQAYNFFTFSLFGAPEPVRRRRNRNRDSEDDDDDHNDGDRRALASRRRRRQEHLEEEEAIRKKVYSSLQTIWSKPVIEPRQKVRRKKKKQQQQSSGHCHVRRTPGTEARTTADDATTTVADGFIPEPVHGETAESGENIKRAEALARADARTLAYASIPAVDKVSRAAYLHRFMELSEDAAEPLRTDLSEQERRQWLQRLDEHLAIRRRLQRDHREYIGRMTRWTFWVMRARLLLCDDDDDDTVQLPRTEAFRRAHGELLGEALLETNSAVIGTSSWLRCTTRLLSLARHLGPGSEALVERTTQALEYVAAQLIDLMHDEVANDHPIYSERGRRAMMMFVRDAELMLGAVRDTLRPRATTLLPPPDDATTTTTTITMTTASLRRATRNAWEWALGLCTQEMLADDVNRAFRQRMHACFLRPDERERYENEQRRTRASAVHILSLFRQHTLDRANEWHTAHHRTPVRDVLRAVLRGEWHSSSLLLPSSSTTYRNTIDGFERLAMDVVLRYYFAMQSRVDALDRFMLDETRIAYEAELNQELPRMMRLYNAFEVVRNRVVLHEVVDDDDDDKNVPSEERHSLARAFVVWLHVMCRDHRGMFTDVHHLWDLYDLLVPCVSASERHERDTKRRECEEQIARNSS